MPGGGKTRLLQIFLNWQATKKSVTRPSVDIDKIYTERVQRTPHEQPTSQSFQPLMGYKRKHNDSTQMSDEIGKKGKDLQLVDILALEAAVRHMQGSINTILDTTPSSKELAKLQKSEANMDVIAAYSNSSRLKLATLLKDKYVSGELKSLFDAILSYDGSSSAGFEAPVEIAKFEEASGLKKSKKQRSAIQGYPPPLLPIKSIVLLSRVFTHKSVINANGKISEEYARQLHNERLELTGDTVLNTCVTLILNEEFPEASEGQITKWRARLVANANLTNWARLYKFDEKLHMDTAMDSLMQGRLKIYADVFEAYVGALSVESGTDLGGIKKWLYELAMPELEKFKVESKGFKYDKDAKNKLYSLIGTAQLSPLYEVEQEGDGDSKDFRVVCKMGSDIIGRGSGISIKEASSRAAMEALANREIMIKFSMERRLTLKDKERP